MSFRVSTICILCLALLGTQLAGLHFHVPGIADHEHGRADHPAPHLATLASDWSADHLAGDHHGESDVESGVGLTSKTAAAILVLALVLWLALPWVSRLSSGVRVPMQWLRPPPLRRWPVLLLPPSQGPPRAI